MRTVADFSAVNARNHAACVSQHQARSADLSDLLEGARRVAMSERRRACDAGATAACTQSDAAAQRTAGGATPEAVGCRSGGTGDGGKVGHRVQRLGERRLQTRRAKLQIHAQALHVRWQAASPPERLPDGLATQSIVVSPFRRAV